MGRRSKDASSSKPDLLALWMGDYTTPPSPGPHRIPWALLVVAGATGVIIVAGYPGDILPLLPIALGLLVAGLALRVLGRRVAESTFLSAPWLVIAALAIALAAYALFAPDIDFTTLARYVPRRLIDFFR